MVPQTSAVVYSLHVPLRDISLVHFVYNELSSAVLDVLLFKPPINRHRYEPSDTCRLAMMLLIITSKFVGIF